MHSLIEACRLSNCFTIPTHNLGGMLDVIVTRDALPTLSVDVIDIYLSDHYLLQCSVPMSQQPTDTSLPLSGRPSVAPA